MYNMPQNSSDIYSVKINLLLLVNPRNFVIISTIFPSSQTSAKAYCMYCMSLNELMSYCMYCMSLNELNEIKVKFSLFVTRVSNHIDQRIISSCVITSGSCAYCTKIPSRQCLS